MRKSTIKWNNYPKLDDNIYWQYHQNFLTPTKIKIDCDLFEKEIEQYTSFFQPWGTHRPDQNEVRFGLPLINHTGEYKDKCKSIQAFDKHNINYPDDPIFDPDFTVKTEPFFMNSLKVLEPIQNLMIRSAILKWYKGADFKKHIDTILPTAYIRLWGTNQPDNIMLRYNVDGEMIECRNVERGRLYLIETSAEHDALCTNDLCYQFFFCTDIKIFDNPPDVFFPNPA